MKHTEHRAHRWWNCRLTRRKSSFCCCCCQRSFESPFEDQGHEYKKEVEGTIFSVRLFSLSSLDYTHIVTRV